MRDICILGGAWKKYLQPHAKRERSKCAARYVKGGVKLDHRSAGKIDHFPAGHDIHFKIRWLYAFYNQEQ